MLKITSKSSFSPCWGLCTGRLSLLLLSLGFEGAHQPKREHRAAAHDDKERKPVRLGWYAVRPPRLQPKDGAKRELEQQADVHTDHVQLTRAANGEEAADTQRCAASSASVQAVHGCPAGDLGAVPAASEEE
eukprot:CAMPEP_0196698904 /NCGR_PEP_ID=MMETSP1090-20130531/45702_1 /TAXON_ID=37098 /ORGANISM="Isochrysis sp, Strain CCMP1244" /LENGTH=131 /DNA_ID=CAMNT_0042038571 /DNA_START=277 /DNA_END=672 /DNA_ORIENTATION=-